MRKIVITLDDDLGFAALIPIDDHIAFCSPEDYEQVTEYSWRLAYEGCRIYARCGYNLYMHHLILPKVGRTQPVHHRNRDGLDNRRGNLCYSTPKENSRDRRSSINGRLGVNYILREGKWRAAIKIAGKSHQLGTFATEAEAISCREAAELLHWGFVWRR